MNDKTPIHLAVLTVEFLLHESGSLKAKRKVIRSILDRIQKSFNVSVSEVGHHDKWQRSRLAMSMIGNNRQVIEKSFTGIEQIVKADYDIEVLTFDIEWV